ncbi:hypothetical protein BDV93DRAFT_33744 [Ceratobasidium sp. AG-I]|nr:hypothetical protein BDV93DRAFT_33744 [Ceratobasidium sp. AG-I]
MSTISVPEYLWETLLPLTTLAVEPPELLELLQKHIKPKIEDTSTEIPYDLITSISKWSASDEGAKTLKDAGIDTGSYSLIPLLAGTTFAPSSKPPPKPEPIPDSSQDRREITALINGMLSVVGVGFAVWWAAGNVHWRNENRVLLALLASIVVAASEGILYTIWSSRKEKNRQLRQKRLEARRAKLDTMADEATEISDQKEDGQTAVSLRRTYELDKEE